MTLWLAQGQMGPGSSSSSSSSGTRSTLHRCTPRTSTLAGTSSCLYNSSSQVQHSSISDRWQRQWPSVLRPRHCVASSTGAVGGPSAGSTAEGQQQQEQQLQQQQQQQKQQLLLQKQKEKLKQMQLRMQQMQAQQLQKQQQQQQDDANQQAAEKRLSDGEKEEAQPLAKQEEQPVTTTTSSSGSSSSSGQPSYQGDVMVLEPCSAEAPCSLCRLAQWRKFEIQVRRSAAVCFGFPQPRSKHVDRV
jgi:hypothetical protein